VQEIDLDNVFFRKLEVTGTPPRNFNAIGLRSVHVSLDYGDPDDPDQHKHGELMFDDQSTSTMSPRTWSAYKNPDDSREFSFAVDYNFDPQAGWDGENDTYSFPATRTQNPQLTLDPFQFLTFAEIQVLPGRIDWDLVDYIAVDLDYTSPSGWNPTRHFELRPDSKTTSWKLRIHGRSALAFGKRITHHLKDGTTIATERIMCSAPAVVVDHPFYYVNVMVEPLLDAARTKQAFVDVKYADPGGTYQFETSIVFTPAMSNTFQNIRFPILDPRQRTWSYRVTLVGAGNQIDRGGWTDTTEQQLFVTDLGAR
jgi:hypothetical protein